MISAWPDNAAGTETGLSRENIPASRVLRSSYRWCVQIKQNAGLCLRELRMDRDDPGCFLLSLQAAAIMRRSCGSGPDERMAAKQFGS